MNEFKYLETKAKGEVTFTKKIRGGQIREKLGTVQV
jgi:hypothetical protein